VEPGQSFTGTVPGYLNGSLVSVTTASILQVQNITSITTGYAPEPIETTTYMPARDSFTDVTASTSATGDLNIIFPTNSTLRGYLVFAAYSFQPLSLEGIGGPDPQNFIQNGSYNVDHFSAVGAKVTTDFLEQYGFVNVAKELIEAVGNYI